MSERKPFKPDFEKMFGGPRPKSPEDVKPEDISVSLGETWGPWTNDDGTGGNAGGFALEWAIRGRGFGVYSFLRTHDGKLECDNEADGQRWVRLVLNAFLDKCEFRDK